MNMTDVSPDTLSTARRLEHDFGMDRKASEGVAIAIYEHTTANLATKADLRQVEEKLRGEIKDLGTVLRGEMNDLGAALRAEMDEFGATLRGRDGRARRRASRRDERVAFHASRGDAGAWHVTSWRD